MNHFLRFHAEWCMPCKASAPAWEKFKAAHSKEFIFEDIDVDKDNATAAKYSVQSIPTLIITNEEGTVLTTRSGSFTLPILEALVQ